MGRIEQNQFDIHFVSSLPGDRFGKHILSYILCPRLHAIGLVIKVEMHFVASLAWEVFLSTLDENYFLMGLFKTC